MIEEKTLPQQSELDDIEAGQLALENEKALEENFIEEDDPNSDQALDNEAWFQNQSLEVEQGKETEEMKSNLPFATEKQERMQELNQSTQAESFQEEQQSIERMIAEDPESQEFEKVEQEKAQKLVDMGVDKRTEEIKKVLSDEKKRTPAVKAAVGVGKAIGSGAKSLYSWLTSNEPIIEKVKDAGQTVAIAVEDTVNSTTTLAIDITEFLHKHISSASEEEVGKMYDAGRDRVEINAVPKEWRTDEKEALGTLLTFLTAYGAASKAYGLGKKLASVKNKTGSDKAKTFAKYLGIEAGINGILDFIFVDPKEENTIGDMLNSIEGLHLVIPDWVKSNEDDSRLKARIKNFVVGAGFGAAAESIIQGLFLSTKLIRLKASKKAEITRKSANSKGISNSEELNQAVVNKAGVDEAAPKDVKGEKPTPKPKEGETKSIVQKSQDEKIVKDIANSKQDYQVEKIDEILDLPDKNPEKLSYSDVSDVDSKGLRTEIKADRPLSKAEATRDPIYKSEGQRKAHVEVIVEKIKPVQGLSRAEVRKLLDDFAKDGGDLKHVNTDFLNEFIENSSTKTNRKKHVKKFLDRLKTPSKGKEYNPNVKKLLEEYKKMYDPKGKPKDFELGYGVATKSAALEKRIIDEIYANAIAMGERLKILKSKTMTRAEKIEYHTILHNFRKLMEDAAALKVIKRQAQAHTGRVLESQKLSQYVDPDRLPKYKIGKTTVTVPADLDYKAVNTMLDDGSLTEAQRMFHLVDKLTSEIKPKGVKAEITHFLNKPLSQSGADILNFLGDVYVGIKLSSPLSKLAAMTGNTIAGGVKFAEENVEWMFSTMGSMFRKTFNIKSASQVIENIGVQRLTSVFVNMRQALRSSTRHLRNAAETQDLRYANDGNWRFSGSDAPLEKLALAFKEGAEEGRWLAKIPYYFFQTLEAAFGLRPFKSIDIFSEKINLIPSLRKRIIDEENALNRARHNFPDKKDPVLTDEQLKRRIDLRMKKAMEDMEARNVDNPDLDAASNEVDEMNFMSNKVSVAGGKDVNVGEGIRTANGWLRKIAGIGRMITPFTNVILNSLDFTTRRVPFFNLINPSTRKLLANGQTARFFAETLTGMSISAGMYALFLRDKKNLYVAPDSKTDRKNLEQITGQKIFSPIAVKDENGTAFAIDETNPLGGLLSYWIRMSKYFEDWKDHGDWGRFAADYFRTHASMIQPDSLMKQWMIFQDLFKEEGSGAGYISTKVIDSALNAGIFRDLRNLKTGRLSKDSILTPQQVNDNYEVSRYYRNEFKKLFERNVPFLSGGDTGVGQTDPFGNHISVFDRSCRYPLDCSDLNHYIDVAKSVGKYAMKKIPVRFEPLHKELWRISETQGFEPQLDRKSPLALYSSRKINLVGLFKNETFIKLLTSRFLTDEDKKKTALKFLSFNDPAVREAIGTVLNTEFIVSDRDAAMLDKISAGDVKFKFKGGEFTGEELIKAEIKFLSKNLKVDPNASEVMQRSQMVSGDLKNREDLGDISYSKLRINAQIFDKYGYSKRDALQKLMFNPQEISLKKKLNRIVTDYKKEFGQDMNIDDIGTALRALMRSSKNYKPHAYSEDFQVLFGDMPSRFNSSSEDGIYLYAKIMEGYSDAKEKSRHRLAMRRQVNKVASVYNEMSRYVLINGLFVNDKAFTNNLYNKVVQEIERVSKPLTENPDGSPKVENFVRKYRDEEGEERETINNVSE